MEDESDEEEDKNGKEEEDKPEKKLGEVIYEIQVPSKAEWKDADVSSDDLKICTVRHFWSTGLDVFNSSGIPPSHAHIDPAFEKLAPRFNTTVRLPSHFARSPLRAGLALDCNTTFRLFVFECWNTMQCTLDLV